MDRQEVDAIRVLAQQFLRRNLLPIVHECESKEDFPLEVYRAFTKTGLHIVHLPNEYGGQNSLELLARISEEMGRIDPGFGLSFLATSLLFAYNISLLGTEEQKRKYLKGVAEHTKLGCWALTEPDVGSDAVGIKTRAIKKGDHYLLNGSKTFITNAPIADYFIIIAREYGEGIEGGTAFVLDRNHPGLECGKPLKKLGHCTSPTGEIFLNDCQVSRSQVLGEPGKAFLDMKRSLDIERIVFGALPLGLMKECLERAVEYSQTRKQFGKRISEFQLIQKKIADMAIQVEVANTYFEKCLSDLANQQFHYTAAVFKSLIASASFQVADTALQVFGGNGYMREYRMEKFLRDARFYSIGGGTSDINNLVVAKETYKRGGVVA